MPAGRPVLRKPGYAAGQRDKLVLIEELTDTIGVSRFPTEAWVPMCMVTMSRLDLSADERFTSNQESAFGQVRWNMPYRPDMDPEALDIPKTRRLRYLSRTYDIQSATPIGRKRAIEVVTLAPSKVDEE